jgi:hypothetical protein
MAIADMMVKAKAWAGPGSYKYSAIPDVHSRDERPTQTTPRPDRRRSILKLVTGGFIIAVVLFFVAGYM